MIRLYSAGTTDFDNNGIGVLSDVISAKVTEERNGIFELEFTYPITGLHYGDIIPRNIVVSKPDPNSSAEPFRIYAISRPISGVVTVSACHISYDLSGVVLAPFSQSSAAGTINEINRQIADSGFSFYSNISTASAFNLRVPTSAPGIMGGKTGSLLDVYGGEYQYRGFQVRLLASRGQNNGVSIRYGKNLTDIKQDIDVQNLYTGVYPYWSGSEDEEVVTLPEGVINAEGDFGFTRIMPLDLSREWQEAPTEQQLREHAEKYIEDNDITSPDVSISVSFVQLGQTDEYKDIAVLEHISLCDTVSIYYDALGVYTSAKVVKTVYNPLTDRYDSIELGKARATIADTVAQQKVDTSNIPTSSYIQGLAQAATEWMTNANGGSIIATKTDDGKAWKDFYIIDAMNAEDAVNVLWFNNRGIALSNSGINGPYSDAWTLETGIVANYITSGVLQASLVRILGNSNFYWDAANIVATNPNNKNQQIRFGLYDGTHYGIGFTTNGGKTWQSAISFNGINFSAVQNEINDLDSRMESVEFKVEPTQIVSTVRSSSGYKSDLNGKVGEDEIISSINQTAEQIKIQASRISLEGFVSINNSFSIDSNGNFNATGGTIGGFTIGQNSIYGPGGTELRSNDDWSVVNGLVIQRYYDSSSGKYVAIIGGPGSGAVQELRYCPYVTFPNQSFFRVFTDENNVVRTEIDGPILYTYPIRGVSPNLYIDDDGKVYRISE